MKAYVQNAFSLFNIHEVITSIGQGATIISAFYKIIGVFLVSRNFFLSLKMISVGFEVKFCFKSLALL